ncbi:hypothetical protein SCMU_40910 [Sinomonas cyclohexanicum]|uniref:Uncharacterized protein n=1 Tax=Sinomonas cyclohexanicum TaxID=322009 RepID=A0ABM7Q106_SINCY|nr:hypothetical protein SCMU_40910 [Corynebacterium cyclohexanicum]
MIRHQTPSHAHRGARNQATDNQKNGINKTWHTIEFSNNKHPQVTPPAHPDRSLPRGNEVLLYPFEFILSNSRFLDMGDELALIPTIRAHQGAAVPAGFSGVWPPFRPRFRGRSRRLRKQYRDQGGQPNPSAVPSATCVHGHVG